MDRESDTELVDLVSRAADAWKAPVSPVGVPRGIAGRERGLFT